MSSDQVRLKLYKIADKIERYYIDNNGDKEYPFIREAKDIEDIIEHLEKKRVI